MARMKVKLQYIVNRSTRRATFNKRRTNLLKKAREPATLCDVDVCVVAYGEGKLQPEVWPASATEATRILSRFKAMPEMEKCKKMVDMEGYLQQRVDKLKEQIEKVRRETHASKTVLLLHNIITGRCPGLAGLSGEELTSFGSVVKVRLEEVRNAKRLQEQGNGDPTTALLLSLASQEPPVPYTAGTGTMEVLAPEVDPQGQLLDVTKAGGFDGESGDLGGDVTGASTYAGLGDMLELGNTMSRLPWADHKPSFPPPM